MPYLPRDFIETAEGLLFAVVDAAPEDGKILCCLRYDRNGKLATAAANRLLQQHYPHYLHYSRRADAHLHAVPLAQIIRHHQPRQRLQTLQAHGAGDAIEAKLLRLLDLLQAEGVPLACIGVTGSVLIGRQNPQSDLDLVIYDRLHFARARALVRQATSGGALQPLDTAAWQAAYARRGCALPFAEFRWHEQRKANKACIDGSKFDLALIAANGPPTAATGWRKTGSHTFQARIVDDDYAFDQPACYRIDHPRIRTVLCFTHTYVGQAQTGENVEAAGAIETAADGQQRLVIGASREAAGEYLRVLR